MGVQYTAAWSLHTSVAMTWLGSYLSSGGLQFQGGIKATQQVHQGHASPLFSVCTCCVSHTGGAAVFWWPAVQTPIMTQHSDLLYWLLCSGLRRVCSVA